MDNLTLQINLYDNLTHAFIPTDTLNGGCLVRQTVDTITSLTTNLNYAIAPLPGKANFFGEPKLIQTNNIPNPYIIPFLVGFLVLAIVAYRYRRYIISFFESVLYSFFAEKAAYETNIPTRRTLTLLDTLSVISFSCISIVSLKLYFPEILFRTKPIILFTIVLASFTLYRLFISVYNYLISNLISNSHLFSLVIYNYFIFIRLVGFVILPISFIAFYASNSIGIYLLYLMFGVILITLLYRLYRLALIFIKNHVSLLYFILYLCGLEVVPILIVIKEVQRI